jgi:hypothetical protein
MKLANMATKIAKMATLKAQEPQKNPQGGHMATVRTPPHRSANVLSMHKAR